MILSYNKSKLPVKIARSRSRTPFIPKKNMLHCARPINCPCGGMVYTSDLKSDSRKGLRVRVPPRAPIGNSSVFWSPKCRLVRLWCVYFTKSEPIFKIGNVSHARSAWHIICFGNRFELGTIKTPTQNSLRRVVLFTHVLMLERRNLF